MQQGEGAMPPRCGKDLEALLPLLVDFAVQSIAQRSPYACEAMGNQLEALIGILGMPMSLRNTVTTHLKSIL